MLMKVDLQVEVEVPGDTVKEANKAAKQVDMYGVYYEDEEGIVKRVLAVTTASKPKK